MHTHSHSHTYKTKSIEYYAYAPRSIKVYVTGREGEGGVKSKASDFDSFKKMYVIIVRWGFPNNSSNDYDATDTIILIHEYLSMDECKCACVTIAIKQQNAITSTTVQQQ